MVERYGKQKWKETLNEFSEDIWKPVRRNYKKIILGIFLFTILLSFFLIMRTSASFNMFPTVFVASLIFVLQMIISLIALFVIYWSSLFQDVFDNWLTEKWCNKYRERNPAANGFSIPSWIRWVSYIPRVLLIIITIAPISFLFLSLPFLVDFIGLADQETLEWLIDELMSDEYE